MRLGNSRFHREVNIMAQFDKEQLRKVQLVDLELAKRFVEFCNDKGLLCYFCGGGCIGAIRHKGFIPWDDDLDFFMPRDDYERLKELWVDDDNYALLYPTCDYNDHNMYITFKDKRTTLIKPYQMDIDTVHGISLDIFPLDGYPNNKLSRANQVFWGLIYQLFCAQIVPNNHGVLVSFLGKAGLGLIRGKKNRYRLWKFAEKKMSKYKINNCNSITELCAGPRYMKNKYPREAFEKAILVPFENTEMPIPIGYDQYLSIAFGDYMSLPPEDKQIPSHEAILIDTERSYLDYKGRFYCVKG
jgi:lipopolysaccharide cholinephosphotransferase